MASKTRSVNAAKMSRPVKKPKNLTEYESAFWQWCHGDDTPMPAPLANTLGDDVRTLLLKVALLRERCAQQEQALTVISELAAVICETKPEAGAMMASGPAIAREIRLREP